jgi:hypothetical protein
MLRACTPEPPSLTRIRFHWQVPFGGNYSLPGPETLHFRVDSLRERHEKVGKQKLFSPINFSIPDLWQLKNKKHCGPQNLKIFVGHRKFKK